MENNSAAAEPPVMQQGLAAKRSGILVRVRSVITTWFGGGVTVVTERTSTEMAQIRTELAESRTLMAADRTLMAWFRTALSMYSFGFTIYKLLQSFQASGQALPQGHTPRNIGLFLVGMGTFAMIMGTIEYWATFQHLRKLEPISVLRSSFIMALLMCMMGIILFFGIVTRIF
jgi:putative membrane protein